MKTKTCFMIFCLVLFLFIMRTDKPPNALASTEKIPISITFNADVWGAQEELFNVLNILSEYNIRSTFFFLGKYAELRPDILMLVFNKGHEIGARSYDHSRRLIDMTKSEQKSDIERTVNLIINAVGQRPLGFAAPGYFYNNDTLQVLKDLGFLYSRSARGALHVSNDLSIWKWQNETKEGINYVGVFSNQRPFVYDQGLYEFPITYSLNYSPFNLTSGLNPIWWERINGTDIILSDGSWFEELQWNQSKCLDVLKYGLRQQIKYGMPLVISLSPHLIGKVEWILVLEEFINFALENNAIFLTLNELLNWWFNKACVRLYMQTPNQIINLGKSAKIFINIYVLRGEIYNVTIIHNFDGLPQNISPTGKIVGNKLIWYFDKLKDNLTISYTITPQYSSLLSPGVTFKHMTLSRHFSFFATLNSSSLISNVISNFMEFYVQISPLIFWAIGVFILMLMITVFRILYKKIKFVQESSWFSLSY